MLSPGIVKEINMRGHWSRLNTGKVHTSQETQSVKNVQDNQRFPLIETQYESCFWVTQMKET